jgi:hypothetical protein
VEEILHEQSNTNRRFGDIALSLGLAKPEHIWRAWLHQLSSRTERIDLTQTGVDVQSLVYLPAALALEMVALPLRMVDHELVVAFAEDPSEVQLATIERHTGKRVKVVLAEPDELARAIERYYAVRRSA